MTDRHTYDQGCRCTPCRTTHSEYNKRASLKRVHRQWGKEFDTDRLDPEYAMKLIWDAYSVRGMSFNQIARVSGLQKKTISRFYYGKRKFITRATETKLRETLDNEWIRLNKIPTELVDRAPYVILIHRLMAQAWTIESLADLVTEYSDFNSGWIHNITRRAPKHYFIEWQNAQACEWLVEFIGDERGPSRRTAVRMQNRGIFPMIHYSETGELLVDSLTDQQRAILRGLRLAHGKTSGSGGGTEPPA